MSTPRPDGDLAGTLERWEAFERADPDAAARYLESRPDVAAQVAAARRSVRATTWAIEDPDVAPLSARLEALPAVTVLHHRRLPGTDAVAHHLVLAPTGLYVVQAWSDQTVVEKRDLGTPAETDHRLFLDGQDRTDLLESALAAAAAVRTVLAGTPGSLATVLPVVCFTAALWPPLFRRALLVRGATVLWPAALEVKLRETGGLESSTRQRVAELLAEQLPPA